MIRFGQIELAIYPNRPLDSMDFNAKEAHHENLNKNQKKIFEIRSADLFPHFRFGSIWYALKNSSVSLYIWMNFGHILKDR